MAPSTLRRSSPVRIHEFAKVAGVSIAAASKALDDTGRMTDATRACVRQAAAELGFRPIATARALLSQRSFIVGLLTNDTDGRFTLPVMAGVSEALVDQGASVFLCTIEDDPALGRIHVKAMLSRQVDGIVASGERIDRLPPVDLSNLPVPMMYAFTKGPEDAVALVSDDANGAREAVEWLAGLGRRRVVPVTGPDRFASVQEHAGTFRSVASEAAPVLLGPCPRRGDTRPWPQLWAVQGDAPDAVFCGNERIARGVVDALSERAVRVPRDVSVAGFETWELMAAATRPLLTTVGMVVIALGRKKGHLICRSGIAEP